MTNNEFIRKYGYNNFYDICCVIPQKLFIMKYNKLIKNYKINNNKKKVKFYREDKNFVVLDFATIYSMEDKKLKKYIDNYKLKIKI